MDGMAGGIRSVVTSPGFEAEPLPKTVLVQFNFRRSFLLTAASGTSCVLKSGGTVPRSKKWGNGIPRNKAPCFRTLHRPRPSSEFGEHGQYQQQKIVTRNKFFELDDHYRYVMLYFVAR